MSVVSVWNGFFKVWTSLEITTSAKCSSSSAFEGKYIEPIILGVTLVPSIDCVLHMQNRMSELLIKAHILHVSIQLNSLRFVIVFEIVISACDKQLNIWSFQTTGPPKSVYSILSGGSPGSQHKVFHSITYMEIFYYFFVIYIIRISWITKRCSEAMWN